MLTDYADSPVFGSDNIKFDLLKTGSVEATCNKILEQGFVPVVRRFLFTRSLHA